MPGKALQLALRFGELSGIRIDNMREQHRHVIMETMKIIKMPKAKGICCSSCSYGDGISTIFMGSGCGSYNRGWTDHESKH